MSFRTPTLGSLNQRVELFAKSETVDNSGGTETNHQSLGFVWAKLDEHSGGFDDIADAHASSATKRLIIRFRTDVKAGDRVVVSGESFEVQRADDPNGRRAYLIVTAVTTIATGVRHV